MRKHSPGFADWTPNIGVREVAAYGRGAETFQSKLNDFVFITALL
jgi:hypothetical protein